MCTLLINASAVRPANIEVAIAPIITRVIWAFLAFGCLKAGTPFAMASTPVRAVQPDENARSVRKIRARAPSEPYPCCTSMWYFALSATGASPISARTKPVMIMTATPEANRYVGAANAVPASLMPRRFTAARTTTNATAICTRWACSDGAAEMMLSTPEETDTATVMT